MDKVDCHSNSLLAFENRDEKQLPLVPPYKLEEMKRRFVTSQLLMPFMSEH